MNEKPIKIFISYAPDDKDIAGKIYDGLKQKGLFPWMDAPDLVPGQKKKETICKAIQESRWFLAILSSSSLSRRGQVHRQIRLALDLLDEIPDSEIFVIPVRTDDCKPGDEKLQNLQSVDLFPSYEKGFANLLRVFSPEQTSFDMPPVEAIVIETDEPNGPFGAKEVGEGAIMPTIPAILNAVYDAVGVRIFELFKTV